MGTIALGALAALLGVITGSGMSQVLRSKGLDRRIADLENAVPHLILRTEVESAFQQVAQIEAQRMAQQQQQARQAAVFGNASATSGAMNQKINDQLAVLTDRINAINDQFGINAG